MKKFFIVLSAAMLLFACKSPVEPVESNDPTPTDETTFEVSDIEALSAEAQSFSVTVKTSVDFTVAIPEDVKWLSYLSTKADVQTKTVEFSVTLNEEDKMRQARVSFNSKDGKTLGTLAVMQKAGGGIEFEVETPEPVAVEGADVLIKVTSNVPYSAATEASWITIGSQSSEGLTVTIASNTEVEPREAEINFYREGTDNLIGMVKVKQNEPHVILNGVGYATLEAALEAYQELSEPATITLDGSVHEGDIIVGEENVPLTVSGNGVATLDGTIEIKGQAATIEGLTIAPSKEGALPVFDTDYQWQHGIMVHDAGLGVTISNVKIDMSKLDANATGIFLLGETKGIDHDIVRSCEIDGGDGHRLMQIYGGRATLLGNTFKGPYSSYAIRIGGSDNDLLLANNTFEGTPSCCVHFYNLSNSSITFGNGAKDNNKFGSGVTPYKANSDPNEGTNFFEPTVTYSAETQVVTVYVDPDAMATLTRVWGYYNGSIGSWDDGITSCSNWNRNGVISNGYVYVPISGNANGQYGIAVFNLADGVYVRTITQGFPMEGRFWTSGIAKLRDYEEDVIYVSNMAMGDSGQKLQIYRLVDPDSEGIPTKAEVAMEGYDVPAGERFGDKMTSYGDNTDGLLFFVSFTKPNQYRTNMEFRVDNGIVAEEPVFSDFLGTSGGNSTASIHMFMAQSTGPNATRQAFYGSNFDFRYLVSWWWGTDKPDGWYQTQIEDGTSPGSLVKDEDGNGIYSDFTSKGNYDSNANDPILFFIGAERYIAYVTVELDSDNHSYGWLRLIHIAGVDGLSANYPIQSAMFKIKDDPKCFQRYALGDSDDFYAAGHEGTNKTAYCDVLQTDSGEIYILAGITSTGMSVFKVD